MNEKLSSSRRSRVTLAGMGLMACVSGLSVLPLRGDETVNSVAQIRKDADALLPTVLQDITRAFLQATAELPDVKPRTLLRDPQTKQLYSQADAAKLDEEARKTLTSVTLGASFYYNTRYGSPLLIRVFGE